MVCAHTSFKSATDKGEDFIKELGEGLRSEARWRKAYQHLREEGAEIDDIDVPTLIREVQADIEKDEREDLKERMWQHFRPLLLKQSVREISTWWTSVLSEDI